MTRAEERALKAFPDISLQNLVENIVARQGHLRGAYIKGYEQAEKDLALTWENIESIVKIADSLLTGTAWDAIDWPDEQKYYEEVLKRFKEAKK